MIGFGLSDGYFLISLVLWPCAGGHPRAASGPKTGRAGLSDFLGVLLLLRCLSGLEALDGVLEDMFQCSLLGWIG